MKSYGQYCPVARAAEVLTERWSLLILRDLLGGSRRFNEFRKGVPLMSPTLLSKRLKSLEEAGVIERRCDASGRKVEYHLTPAGEEAQPMIEMLGIWGQRWVRNLLGEDDLDVGLLMWDISGRIEAGQFPAGRSVIQFEFTDVSGPKKLWWLVAEAGEVDLCIKDPGFEADLYVTADLRTMTKAWMGDMPIKQAVRSGEIELHGSAALARGFDKWMQLSVFAGVERPQKDCRPRAAAQ
jgi:DNA-binding HxlR family transcriptional regulator